MRIIIIVDMVIVRIKEAKMSTGIVITAIICLTLVIITLINKK